MKLLITTQVYENYGAHDWDGVGECPSYWKAKGGNDYVIKNLPWQTEADFQNAVKIVDQVRVKIDQNTDYFRETCMGWQMVEDDYLTEFERSQLAYEGKIAYPAREILVDSLVD